MTICCRSSYDVIQNDRRYIVRSRGSTRFTISCPYPGGCCNKGYPSKTHLWLKSREISFVQNIPFGSEIVMKICTEHDSDTVVLCAHFQNDSTTATNVMDERDFARFEFRTDPILQPGFILADMACLYRSYLQHGRYCQIGVWHVSMWWRAHPNNVSHRWQPLCRCQCCPYIMKRSWSKSL